MRVTVIGLGYVGLTAAAVTAHLGHDVLGVEIDHARLKNLQASKTGIFEPGLDEMLASGLTNGRIQLAHVDDVGVSDRDVIMVAVGTPSKADGAADTAQILAAVHWALEHTTGPSVVVMKSSVPPGTGVSICDEALAGTQFQYASNPEFLRQGSAVQDWLNPARIVIGGQTPEAVQTVEALYATIEAPVVRTDPTTAEMIKYASNALLVTKISFINEIAMLSEKVGSDIDDITYGLSLDPRIGPSSLGAGIGWGGSCFPKDARALEFLAAANGNNFELLTAVISVNDRQKMLPFKSLQKVFGSLQNIPVAVLGLTFKPGTDDLRDAPAITLIQALHEAGAEIRAFDPEGSERARVVLPEDVDLKDNPMDALRGAKAAVIATEWPDIVSLSWDEVATLMDQPRFIFDGRNALDIDRMISLGFQYRGVGRRVVPGIYRNGARL